MWARRDPVVIFDVDGTLCDTCRVDADCFVAACSDFLGSRVHRRELRFCPEFTDIAAARWIFERHAGRTMTSQDEREVRQRFLIALESEFVRSPKSFRPIPGAAQLFDGPLRLAGAKVATGGWKRTAESKLRFAGLPCEPLIASCDDSARRVEIFRHAVEQLRLEGAESIVLVGDGVWDFTVAGALKLGFVGIAKGRNEESLRNRGARWIFGDFGNVSALRNAVRRADAEAAGNGDALKR